MRVFNTYATQWAMCKTTQQSRSVVVLHMYEHIHQYLTSLDKAMVSVYVKTNVKSAVQPVGIVPE